MRALVLAIGLVTAMSATVRAEDVVAYEVDGDASTAAADPRVTALDDAFARAVGQAIGELVDAEVRKANQSVLDREIFGHARLWVAKFTVTRDATADGRRQLQVVVRVDRDKLRARLDELGVATATSGGRPAIVLLRISWGDRVRASFGATAERELPGLSALADQLRKAGVAVKPAPATTVEPRPAGELPIDDPDADALAADAHAELATIASVTVAPPVAVRGLPGEAALVTARIRVVGHGKLVGQGTVAVAARGTDPAVIGAAIDRALVAAASDAMPVAPTIAPAATFEGDDTPIAEPGVVLVRIAAKTPYPLVEAELRYLAGARGVSRAVLRRLGPGGWVVGVTTTEPVSRIAAIARRSPTSSTTARVKQVGDRIELSLVEAP